MAGIANEEIQLFTAAGTSTGIVYVSDSSKFVKNADVRVLASGQVTLQLKIEDVLPNQLVLINPLTNIRPDLSGYTVPGNARVFQPSQTDFAPTQPGNSTTTNLTLWVDGSVGLDSNSGSEASPFRTITGALAMVPVRLAHTVLINVKAGTYAETIIDGRLYAGDGITFSTPLTIRGVDWVTPTLASGSITSGTLGSWSAPSLARTVAGAAWNVNELKGKFVYITSGANAGRRYPIAANTATTLDIPFSNTTLNSCTFEIVESAVIVTRKTGTFASAIVSSAAAGPSTYGINFEGIRFVSGSTYNLLVQSGTASVSECHLSGHTTVGISTNGTNGTVSISRCYVETTSTRSSIRFGGDTSFVILAATVLDGGSFGIDAQRPLGSLSLSAIGPLVIQNATTGLHLANGTSINSINANSPLIIRNGTTGMVLGGKCNLTFHALDISTMSSHGIQIASVISTANGNVAMGGHCGLDILGSSRITGCGGDAIRVESAHNRITLRGSVAITANTGIGVRLATAVYGTHNGLFVESGVSMSTNTAGDLSIDGTATSTVAAMRALSPKRIVDANYFNSITGT